MSISAFEIPDAIELNIHCIERKNELGSGLGLVTVVFFILGIGMFGLRLIVGSVYPWRTMENVVNDCSLQVRS